MSEPKEYIVPVELIEVEAFVPVLGDYVHRQTVKIDPAQLIKLGYIKKSDAVKFVEIDEYNLHNNYTMS